MVQHDSAANGVPMKNIIVALLCSIAVSGCATGIQVKKYNPGEAKKEAFKQCRGFGCSYLHETRFTDAEWKKVAAIFKNKPARTAKEERSKIASAIGLMERIIGKKTGADADLAEANMTTKTPYQLDCIDETTNTTHYLLFLQDAGLLKFHKEGNPIHRGYFINGWPHNTATIKELSNNQQWAVDSYFSAAGEEPFIVRRDSWLSYWHPGDPQE